MSINGFMNGMFGKIAPGMCRLSMNGEIAAEKDKEVAAINAEKNPHQSRK